MKQNIQNHNSAETIKEGVEVIIPFDEIINTTRASFAAIDSLKEGKWISVK